MANYFQNVANTQASVAQGEGKQGGANAGAVAQNAATVASNLQPWQYGSMANQQAQPKVPGMTDTQFSNLYQAPATTGGATGAGFENTPGYQGLAAWGGNQFAGEQAMTKGAVNPAALGLSARYQQNYQMTPEEIQGLATSAGRTVGNQFQSMSDQAARSGAAAGMSAEGTLAEQERLGIAGSAQAGATMADARLNAQLAALGVEQNREATRLGAEQGKAGIMLNQAGQNIQEVGQATNTGMGVLNAESGLGVTAAQMGQQGQQAQFSQGLQSQAQVNQNIQDLNNKLASGVISQQQFQASMLQLQNQIYGTTNQNVLAANQQSFTDRSTPVWQQILSGVEGLAGAAGSVMGGMGNMAKLFPGGSTSPSNAPTSANGWNNY